MLCLVWAELVCTIIMNTAVQLFFLPNDVHLLRSLHYIPYTNFAYTSVWVPEGHYS